jgi:hypothetical protein
MRKSLTGTAAHIVAPTKFSATMLAFDALALSDEFRQNVPTCLKFKNIKSAIHLRPTLALHVKTIKNCESSSEKHTKPIMDN